MIRIGRLGIERRAPFFDVKPFGWCHVIGWFWWFDPKAERELLEAYARVLGTEPREGETSEALRARMVRELAKPPRSRASE
jgi:hypothetical protein